MEILKEELNGIITRSTDYPSGSGVLFFRKYLEEKSSETKENKKKDKKFLHRSPFSRF